MPARLVLAVAAVLIVSAPAFAHIPGHPEWDAWFMRQQNTFGTSCCDLKDAHEITGDDIRPYLGAQKAGEEEPNAEWHHWYDVRLHGQWFPVYYHQFVRGRQGDPNPTGSALIWYTWYPGPHGDQDGTAQIWCFEVGAGA